MLVANVVIPTVIPDHYRAYALSDPRDKDYQIICPHDHLETCDRCYLLSSVLAEIHNAIEKVSDSNVSSDVVEEVNFIEGPAKQNIWAWKAHLLFCVNQDEARIEVIDALDENSVLLVQESSESLEKGKVLGLRSGVCLGTLL